MRARKHHQRFFTGGRARRVLIAMAVAMSFGALAVPAGAYVYWTEPGVIDRAKLDGSGAITVAYYGGGQGIAVDAGHLYWSGEWTGPGDTGLMRSNLDGTGTERILVIPNYEVGPIAIDATHIYWATGVGIGRANLDGTNPDRTFITLPGLASQPKGLAVDGQYIYWTAWTTGTNDAIGRARLDDPSNPDLSFVTLPGHTYPWGVAVDGTYVYWANDKTQSIGRARLDDPLQPEQGFIPSAGQPALGQPRALAVYGGYIYWGNASSSGTSIGRATVAGSGVNPDFIDGFINPSASGLAVDARPFAPTLVAAPQVSGTPRLGETLSCSSGSWSAVGTLTYTYDWLRDGTRIDNPGGPTYTIVSADIGRNVSCRVTADDDGARASATSGSVRVFVPPSNAQPPVMSGDMWVGQTLTCSTGAWYGDGPLTYAYQWQRDRVAISGATSNTYVLTGADVGHMLQCSVTATGPGGSAGAASGGQTINPGPAAAPGNLTPPAVGGLAEPGQTLTCATGSWSGTPPFTFGYQWLRDDVAIPGATANTHSTTMIDAGHLFACKVTGRNAMGEATATSAGVRIAPVASVPGRVGTLGALLKFRFICQGAGGQRCQGQASANAIEKLSADGKTITGVLASKPRTGRYKVVVVVKGNLSASGGTNSDIAIWLNSTGQLLRNRFKNVPADVQVTAATGGKTTTIKTAKVTFGPDPPKVSIAGMPTTKRTSATVNLRCRGLSTQVCRGAVELTTFEKLSADGRTITGLASAPSGKGKLVTIASGGWSVRAGKTLTLVVGLNATGKSLLAKLGKVPATLKITPTFNGYTLTAITAKITFKR